MVPLAEIDKCTGCTACGSACPVSAITFQPDRDGFPYPQTDPQKCIRCGLCEAVCPVLHPAPAASGRSNAYAAYSADKASRLDSSSGGIFSELAREIISRGGTVYAAAYDEQLSVRHMAVRSPVQLPRLRGAKYAQSILDGIFPQIRADLRRGTPVLFCGTPCQVAGLKGYLEIDFENLITVDFICHSIPSPMAWQAFLRYQAHRDNAPELPSGVNLRDKASGWSRYSYSHRFFYPDGRNSLLPAGDSLYMKLFTQGFISRKSCAHCPMKGWARSSDLTIGDFWGIWEVAPEMDDNLGTSAVLCHTAKGLALFDQVSPGLILRQVAPEDVSRCNPAFSAAIPAHPRRERALELIRSGNMALCRQFFPPLKRKPFFSFPRKFQRPFRR